MNRLKQNFLGGQLAVVDIADTTITSPEFANLPVITNGVEYMVAVFDPDGQTGAPEVVYITAHTALATTATVSRAQEGTTARDHPASTFWVHGPTALDDAASWIDNNVDNVAYWGADIGFDYEFDADTTSLPAGFSWVNQGSSTYLEKFGKGVITGAASSSINWRALVQSISGSTWEATIKTDFLGRDGVESANGLVLRESGTGKLLTFYWYSINTFNSGLYIVQWASPTDVSPTVVVGPLNINPHNEIKYFRVKKNSSTSYDFQYSSDGVAWLNATTAYNPTATMTPDEIGFGAYNTLNLPYVSMCEWIRVR